MKPVKLCFIYLSCLFVSTLLQSCKSEKITEKEQPKIVKDSTLVIEPIAEVSIQNIVNNKRNLGDDLRLFSLRIYETSSHKKLGFVSLSDAYVLSTHPDSLAIPEKVLNREYIKLESKYRDRFLSKTKISESDKLYTYNYRTNSLDSVSVQNLRVVARINDYATGAEGLDQKEYMIGFEIESRLIDGIVAVSNQNPFVLKGMKPMIWEKIESGDLPKRITKSKIDSAVASVLGSKSTLNLGDAYRTRADGFIFYIQDVLSGTFVLARFLSIEKEKSGEIIMERIFFDMEDSYLVPLMTEQDPNSNELWSGRLFKNKPPVFTSIMVAYCNYFLFLDSSGEGIRINCDNRW